jgi:hypothetical protein
MVPCHTWDVIGWRTETKTQKMRIVLEWISNKKDTKIFTLYPNYPVSKIIIKQWSLLFRENKTSFAQLSLEDMRS